MRQCANVTMWQCGNVDNVGMRRDTACCVCTMCLVIRVFNPCHPRSNSAHKRLNK